tara:strand:+ start:346 stop:825 length:480 start_codon:yes stop_codon:yes gene_type:complete
MRKILYPGTFDPIHNGHIDIAIRTADLFDQLEFVVAVNPEKKTLFSVEERVYLIKNSVKSQRNIIVNFFNGLVVEYASSKGHCAIIRGLRHVSDFEFEFQMAMMNFHLKREIKSLFMMPDEKFIHLNSSVVKDVSKNGGDVSAFVPDCVQEALFSKFSN